MRIVFYLGCILIISAFFSASAELIVRLYADDPAIITPAYDLLYTLWPGALTVMQIRVERIALFLWDPVLTTILAFPAWFLLGVPGITLAWLNRPGRILSPLEQEEHRKQIESLYLFDELAKDAKRQGYSTGNEDPNPDYDALDALKIANQDIALSDEELFEAIVKAHKNRPEPPKET